MTKLIKWWNELESPIRMIFGGLGTFVIVGMLLISVIATIKAAFVFLCITVMCAAIITAITGVVS